MSSVKTWSTKKQVMTDLARASGRRMKKIDDLDEGYLVIGDAPPPIIVEDEDDEMRLLFSEAAYRKTAFVEDTKPDLQGIQQMLRMVQNSEDDDDVDVNNTTNPTDCIIAITKASNLNPNVEEFIPKSATTSSVNISKNIDLTSQSRSTINNEVVGINVDDDDNNVNTNVVTQSDDVLVEDSSNILKDNDINSGNIGDKKLNEDDSEYKNITSQLKDKISEAAKSDSFELKKQKNVAIATLLKLYAGDKSRNRNKTTTELKLVTPDFYQSKKDNNDLKAVTKEPQTPSSSSSTVEPQTTYTSISIPTGSSTSISSTPPQTLENRSTPIKIDPEIKRSIEKVHKWLEEPARSKTPAVCLGPIAFKKKDPQSCKSPITSEQKTSKPSAGGQRYQPSNYAADLGRKYMERNKIKEEQKNKVTWTNLENILKQKDETIRKRLEEQASRSAHDSTESLTPQL